VEGLNCSLSWLGTGTSIKSGGIKLLSSLSWLGTGTSIKSGGVKQLTFLAWYRHFNKKWRG
jgi:hypothetical protein